MNAVVESGVTHLPGTRRVLDRTTPHAGGVAGLSPARHRATGDLAREEGMRRLVATAAAARRRAAAHPQGWWFA